MCIGELLKYICKLMILLATLLTRTSFVSKVLELSLARTYRFVRKVDHARLIAILAQSDRSTGVVR